nr:retrovirus-related Pol polyprotein from transposon TNT 1-94 [Tanacetum cinerariifolium]
DDDNSSVCSSSGEFEMTDLGKMRYFLGVEVFQTSAGIHVSQQRYAIEILTRFNMLDSNCSWLQVKAGRRWTCG